MFPELASSEGAEFLENLVRIGQGSIERITQECARQGVRHAPLSIVAADILEIDWSHADIILCNNVTWGPELLNSVV